MKVAITYQNERLEKEAKDSSCPAGREA